MPQTALVSVRVQVTPSSWLTNSAFTTAHTIVFGGPSRMVTQWMSELVTPSGRLFGVPSVRSQVVPRSRLRHRPPSSMPNHAEVPSAWSHAMVRIRGLLTPAQRSGISGGSRSQEMPPSTVRNTAARDGAPVPASMLSGSAGSMAIDHTCMPSNGELTRDQVTPASPLRASPMSAPANTTPGSAGWTARQRTTASNSTSWPSGIRYQVTPSSELRSTPCPAVATRTVPCTALLLVLSEEDAAAEAVVDAERFTGDAARARRGEEACRLRDLARGQHAADRRAVDEILFHFGGGGAPAGRDPLVQLVNMLGLHDAGMKGVHRDSKRRLLSGQLLGHVPDGDVAHAGQGMAGRAGQPADVDNPAVPVP